MVSPSEPAAGGAPTESRGRLDGWKQIALKAVHDHDAGDDEMLDLLVHLLL